MICCHGNYCYVTNRNLCLCGKKQYYNLGKHKYLKLETDKNKEACTENLANVEFGIRKKHICNFQLLESPCVHKKACWTHESFLVISLLPLTIFSWKKKTDLY